MALFRRRPPTVLTAAGSQVRDPSSPQSRSQSPDAAILYSLYARLGPIHAAMQSKYLAASKISYFPAQQGDPGTDPERVESGPAVEAFDRLRGPQGVFSDFVAEMSMHWEIAGEGYLVGQTIDSTEQWDVWSPMEYDRFRQKQAQKRSNDEPDELGVDDLVFRSWRSSPARREEPDSPLRSVQVQCEQYLAFGDMLTALAQSRLIAPLLITPSEMDFPATDANGNAQTFGSWLMKAMSAAVNDSQNANRLTPITLEVPYSMKDGFGTVDLTRDLEAWVPDVMDKILRQIAIGLDIPADILTGIADVNHWSAWLIDDSLRLNYVDPLILSVLDSLTRAYLLPTLTAAGVPDAETYLFWRDYSDLTSRTVSSNDALAAFNDNLISDESARRVMGFTEADKPEAERSSIDSADLAARVTAAGVLIRSGFTPSGSLQAMGLPVIEHTGLLPVTVKDETQVEEGTGSADPATVEIGTDPPPPATNQDAERGIPDTLTAAAARGSFADIDHRLYSKLSEAAQAALDRSLERAGQRIRSKVQGDTRNNRSPEFKVMADAVFGIDPIHVAMTLGRDAVYALGFGEQELVPDDAFDRFGKRAEALLTQGQSQTRSLVRKETGAEVTESDERSWVDKAVAFLISGLVLYARSRLFTPDLTPDPAETGEVPDTDVPASMVFDTMTLAGDGTLGVFEERGLATGAYGQTLVHDAGFSVQERVWSVGAPRVPFEPHHNLNGFRFERWTDERLRPPVSALWLGVEFMHPSDHRNCVCAADLIIKEEPNE